MLVLVLMAATAMALQQHRVAGGAAAPTGLLPFQCALYNASSSSFLCGCSLVSRSWVLTAASCVRRVRESQASEEDLSLNGLRVLFGAAADISRPSETVPVARALVHPAYAAAVPAASRVDLAWLQLEWPPVLSSVVRPVALVGPAEAGFFGGPGAASLVTVAGWGATANQSFPKALQVVAAPVVGTGMCDALQATAGQQRLDGAVSMCAGQAGSGVCRGDAGGSAGGVERGIGTTDWGDGKSGRRKHQQHVWRQPGSVHASGSLSRLHSTYNQRATLRWYIVRNHSRNIIFLAAAVVDTHVKAKQKEKKKLLLLTFSKKTTSFGTRKQVLFDLSH